MLNKQADSTSLGSFKLQKIKKKTPELDNLEKWLEIQSGIV